MPGPARCLMEETETPRGCPRGVSFNGGREGIRTPGLIRARDALSQLSYPPIAPIVRATVLPCQGRARATWEALRARRGALDHLTPCWYNALDGGAVAQGESVSLAWRRSRVQFPPAPPILTCRRPSPRGLPVVRFSGVAFGESAVVLLRVAPRPESGRASAIEISGSCRLLTASIAPMVPAGALAMAGRCLCHLDVVPTSTVGGRDGPSCGE